MAARGEGPAIVLCAVREPANVGSVCRAMKAMGFRRLVLAGCPEYDEERVRSLAVHAYDVYEAAARAPDLRTALSGFRLAAGFTRRQGARRKSRTVPLREFAAGAAGGGLDRLALVFGNERTGLTDEELESCTLAVHIPTSEECPSLNVAQAVQIACYELSALPGTVAAQDTADRRAIEDEVGSVAEVFRNAGFFRKSSDEYAKTFLRDLCERAAVTREELGYLGLLMKKAASMSAHPSPRRHTKKN